MAEEKETKVEEQEEEKKETQEPEKEEKDKAAGEAEQQTEKQSREEKKQEGDTKQESVAEEKEEEEVEVPDNLKKIVETIEQMKLVDLAVLVKVLEKKFGVSSIPIAAAPMAPAGGAGTGAPAGEAEQKKEVNVVLTSVGEKKIDVIKAVKEITQKGLKDCKDLVDAVASGPQIVLEKVKVQEAEEMKKKLEAAGATVELN